MKHDYRELARRWTELVWNQRRYDVINIMMAPHCKVHVEGMDQPLARDDFRGYLEHFVRAVPDVIGHVLHVTVEGEKAVMSWRITGTHLGPGLGIPPTGRPIDIRGLTLFEFEDGLIVGGADRWNRGEFLASLMQVRVDELRSQAGLTEREAQVALLMAERFTYKEIAAHLMISPNTARRHCEKVLFKLGVHQRQDVGQALGKLQESVLNRHGADLESLNE